MAKRREITVPLPAELHEYVRKKVREGDYLDPGDVVRQALAELKEQDEFRQYKLNRLRDRIDVGIDESQRGLTRPFDAAALRRIETPGRKRLAARRNGKK